MKYRKKPVVIEAIQWAATKASFDEIMAMGNVPWKPGPIGSDTFIITTLEGDHTVSKGDFVIMGVAGEFYPCKPDIFEKTYEPASLPNAQISGGTPSAEADCSASVVSKGPDGYSPCGGCSPESTSDYAACAGCKFNPDKPNAKHQI